MSVTSSALVARELLTLYTYVGKKEKKEHQTKGSANVLYQNMITTGPHEGKNTCEKVIELVEIFWLNARGGLP